MKKNLAIMAAAVLAVTGACTTVNKRAPGDFGGMDAEKLQTLNRPAEVGAEVTDKVIEGESSAFQVLGLFSWGTDIQFTTPLIKNLLPIPVPLAADPLRNAIGDAVEKGDAEGIYVTHVHAERFRLIDFGFITDNLPEEGPLAVATYPIKLAFVGFKFLEGLYERNTVKVTGRAIKLKPLGIVSAARFDAYKAISSSLCSVDCKGQGARNNGPYR